MHLSALLNNDNFDDETFTKYEEEEEEEEKRSTPDGDGTALFLSRVVGLSEASSIFVGFVAPKQRPERIVG
jgi:hypothetical protein|tara:strand:+ start:202 stop:414 length:213 start_codon:yes stop_codon:yes gene_type:complete